MIKLGRAAIGQKVIPGASKEYVIYDFIPAGTSQGVKKNWVWTLGSYRLPRYVYEAEFEHKTMTTKRYIAAARKAAEKEKA